MSIVISDDSKKIEIHLRGLTIGVSEEELQQIISFGTHTLKRRYEANASRNMMRVVNGIYQLSREKQNES